MAKKHREPTVVIFDRYIEYLYQNGILHSFIINSSIILILGLVVNNCEIITKPIIISISNVEATEQFSESVFLEIESVLPESDKSTKDATVVVVPEPQNDKPIEIGIPELVVDSKQQEAIVEHKDLFTDLIKETNTKGGPVLSKGNSNISGKGKQTLQRLKDAGAQTGDVQVSIAWDNYNDIDLWVVLENQYGEFLINWTNRTGPGNGMLDIDRNVRPTTNEAVENIFWHHGLAPEGKYTVYIQHYWQWDKQDTTPVFLRVLVDGKITEKMVSVGRHHGIKKVYSFYRKTIQKNQNYDPETSDSIGPHLPIGQLWSGQ